MAKKPKSDQSKAYDRDVFNRLVAFDRLIKKTAPKPPPPKKGKK